MPRGGRRALDLVVRRAGGDERAQRVVHDQELEDADPAAIAARAVRAAGRVEERAGPAVERETE